MFRFRVASFSLLEMLVAMVLSSIIVGIIYFSFSTIAEYEMKLSAQKRNAEDFGLFYYNLKKDLQQSTTVTALNEEEISCLYENGKEVSYIFFADFILRRQLSRVDTFVYNLDQPVFLKDGAKLDSFPRIMDELQLDVVAEQPFHIFLLKQYDAASLLNELKTDSLP